MTGVALAINASAGSPAYAARAFRNAQAALMNCDGDPVGGKQGLRPMGGTAVVTLAGSTITVNLHAGLVTPGWAGTTGTYQVALTATEAHALTPADATNPRKDIVIGRVYDHDEAASGQRLYQTEYIAGLAGPGPSEPNVPQGAIRLATIDVPQSGGGSPVVTINNPITVAAGGLLPIRSSTERAALTPYDGLAIYRRDRDWVEIHDGTAWRVQGVAICTSTADRDAAITSPVSGQLAVTTDADIVWQYDGAAWAQMCSPKTPRGILAPPVQATGNVPFGGETLVDSITFTHTNGRYERVTFNSQFSLNASGVAIMRYRYVAGSGPVTTSGTDVYSTLPTGSGSNNNMSLSKVLPASFRGLASGTYTIGVFATAAAGASSGTINGAAGGNGRDFVVEDAGAP